MTPSTLKSPRLTVEEFERNLRELVSVVDKARTRSEKKEALPEAVEIIISDLIDDYKLATNLILICKEDLKDAQDALIALNTEILEVKSRKGDKMSERYYFATPKKYAGKRGLDARQWVIHFDMCCTSNEWTDIQKINRMFNYLEGSALSWYMAKIKEKIY